MLKNREKERYEVIITERQKTLTTLASRVTGPATTPSPSPTTEVPISPSPQPSVSAIPLPTPNTSPKTQTQLDTLSTVIAKTFSGLVFIQFSPDAEEKQREKLRNELITHVLRFQSQQKSIVLIQAVFADFNKGDIDLAAKIKAIVNKIEPNKNFRDTRLHELKA